MTKQFKKMAILDNILLDRGCRLELHDCAEQLITFSHPSASDDETVDRLRGCDACITCWTKISERVMRETPDLAYIAVWSHWTAQVLDMQVANRMGVWVDFLPDYATDSVAEAVFTGILVLSRRIVTWYRDAGRGSWKYEYVKKGAVKMDSLEEIQEHTVTGKTLGVVGMGRIGTAVARTARLGFGMHVLYSSRTRKRDIEDKIGVEHASMERLLGQSHVVTLHVSPDITHHVIGSKELSLLRESAILVNTSVGHAVDQNALLSELRSGRICAYLDVFDGYPPRKDLRALPNVLFTYRNGWFTRESIARKGRMLIDKVQCFLKFKGVRMSTRRSADATGT